MKPRLFTSFVVASFYFLFTNSALELRAATITADGFRLEIPDGWEVLQEEKTIFTIRAPKDGPDDSFGENLRVVRHSVGKVLTVEEVVAAQKSNTGRFKLIGEGKVSTAKVPMAWIALTPKAPRGAGDRLVKIDFITTFDTDVVVLTAMAESEVWKSHLPTFEKIASTFARVPNNNQEASPN